MAPLKSFVEVSPESHFPLENLPYGVFRPASDASSASRPGVAIGSHVLDLSAVASAGLFDGPLLRSSTYFHQTSLNAFLEMGHPAWKEARSTLQKILSDERLNDIVGSAYYVAPEVLHRSYSTEADIWSIGVITYILLCGSRPFWARTESEIFRSVLRVDPNFEDAPWPSISAEARDFVKRFLNKDYRKRMTAAQALTHPWLRDEEKPVPLDILIYKLVKSYLRSSPFKRSALKLEPLSYKAMNFEDFCAAAVSPYQLEALEGWEQMANTAFQHFELDGNRVISVQELTKELNLNASAYSIVKEWIRANDGKLSFIGYTKFLHGVTVRSNARQHR